MQANDQSLEEPLYTVTAAAELAGMHPQTLRQYDRLGLVQASRTKGRDRRYTGQDVRTLREIQRLSKEQGLNLAGIAMVLELRNRITVLEREIQRMTEAARKDFVPAVRVFAADSEGAVRLRSPRAPAKRPVTTAPLVSGRRPAGWELLAQLQLARSRALHRRPSGLIRQGDAGD